MLRSLAHSLLDPSPLRTVTKAFIRSFNVGSYAERVRIGAVERPGYAYCTYYAADLAKRLGKKRISVLELGVAGGNGLLQLERRALATEEALSIKVDVFGFDTGEGLPPPTDCRDLPYIWQPGFFKMEPNALRKRLSKAELVLGDVGHTLRDFLQAQDQASVGAVMIDVDYYSSTTSALTAIRDCADKMLPRSFLYFDDVVGDVHSLYNEFTGELGAINDFNAKNGDMKIAAAAHLAHMAALEPWMSQVYVLHAFRHPLYNRFVGHELPQLPLK